jgi:hypothetical protein
MPRSPLGWTLTIAVPALAVAVAFLLAGGGKGGGASGPDAAAQAAAVCQRAELELRQMPDEPQSVDEAMQVMRGALALYSGEIADLEALAPRLNDAFRASLADDRRLLHAYDAMISRPDFVRLAVTLPDHPELAPGWLKPWLARQHALQRDAAEQFSHAGVPACERSMGFIR